MDQEPLSSSQEETESIPLDILSETGIGEVYVLFVSFDDYERDRTVVDFRTMSHPEEVQTALDGIRKSYNELFFRGATGSLTVKLFRGTELEIERRVGVIPE